MQMRCTSVEGFGFQRRLWKRAAWSLLLPDGYPNSVTPDYLEFQIWDTIQV
jgi:hypothetical protein